MTVSVNTARKLELAGFPPPPPNEGQRWFNKKTERACVVMHNVGNYRFRISYFGSAANKGGILKDGQFVYMPTATDILRELPGWSISRDETREVWVVFMVNILSEDATTGYLSGVNPAEVAAAAWLQLTEIEKEQDK